MDKHHLFYTATLCLTYSRPYTCIQAHFSTKCWGLLEGIFAAICQWHYETRESGKSCKLWVTSKRQAKILCNNSQTRIKKTDYYFPATGYFWNGYWCRGLIQGDQKSLCTWWLPYSRVDDLKTATTGYIRNVDLAILNTVFENTVWRVNKCLETGRGHFEHYL
jgi:hypothetical protein